MPAFSIIIPLYNCELYIEDCLNSLKHQTMGNFEVFVIDDASSDNSVASAKKAIGDDARFKLLALPHNQGPSTARNRGLAEANGKIIVFLDSDDCLTENALALIYERMVRQELDVLYFNAKTFFSADSSKGTQLEVFTDRPDFEEVASGIDFFTYCEMRRCFYPNAALQAFDRHFLERHSLHFREGIIHEDLFFTMQAMVNAQHVSFLNEQLYLRRVRANSIMTARKKTSRNIEGHFASVRFLKRWCADNIATVSDDFLTAIAHRLNEWYDLCANYWANDLTEEDKRTYLASLPAGERFELEENVIQRAEVLQTIYGSLSWKFGRAATALPRHIADKISQYKQTH